MSRHAAVAEAEQRALKQEASLLPAQGNEFDEQLIRSFSLNSEASRSKGFMSISDMQIELARKRVKERRHMLDRIMSPNASLLRENGNISVHDVVDGDVEEMYLFDQGRD